MIKILFFIENLTEGGAEKVLRNLVNNMDQTQFDITVQTVWPCDSEKYLAKGIHYKSLFTFRNALSNLRYRFEAETGLAYKLHIRDDFDIEVAYLECGATKVMAGSANKKAKKLAWVHCDLQKAMADPKAFARQTAPYYAKFDRVVCVSENVKKSFLELYGDIVPVDVIYNTVDEKEIWEKAERPIPGGLKMPPMTAVSVGRLTAQKNFLRLLKAHKRLLMEGILHDVWILGEGPERAGLEQFIAENDLNDTVKLFGFQENPYPYMHEADLLVCSSDYEGFSTFVTEGVILGKPIVTTDCTGMREILGDSEYGLITELSDDGLYGGMKRMLTEPTLRESYMHMAGKQGKTFTGAERARRTEQYLKTIMGE